MSISLRTMSPPATAAVGLDVIKQHLRVDHDADDALIAAYLDAATTWVESISGRALVNRTLRLTLSRDPVGLTMPLTVGPPIVLPMTLTGIGLTRNQIELPRSPLVSVTSVVLYDQSGTPTTLVAGTDYQVNDSSEPGRVRLTSTLASTAEMVEITFIAGYGTTPIPQPIVSAIMLLTAYLYEGRGDMNSEPPRAVDYLLSPFRVWSFGGPSTNGLL